MPDRRDSFSRSILISSFTRTLIESPFGSVVGLPFVISSFLIYVGQNTIGSLLELLTTPARGLYITPSRSSSADAGKSARRPMGTAALARSLFVGCLRQWSQECQVFNISSIRQTQICLIDVFKNLYIMHNYNRYYCTYCITPCVHCLLSVPHVHFYHFCMSRRLYNSGFSISGSCKAALCFSAICWAVCCGTPYCCPACTGAVSAIP